MGDKVAEKKGAGSTNPDVSPRRLGEVFVQAGKDLMHDSGPQWAAAIAYYSLLSTFPLLLATVAIAAYFVDAQWVIGQVTRMMGNFIPRGSGQIENVIREAIRARESVGLFSILLLLWSGSRVFGAVTKAMNIAFDADETYGFLKRVVVEFSMVLTIGLLFIAALIARTVINIVAGQMGLISVLGNSFLQILLSVLSALLLLLAFFLIYLYIPRRRVNWPAALLGSSVATLLFVIARPLFLRYIQQFASYNLIYGSLAIVVALILWAWIVALILIFGGEVASHAQAMVIEGESKETVERQHLERSPTRKREAHRARS